MRKKDSKLFNLEKNSFIILYVSMKYYQNYSQMVFNIRKINIDLYIYIF